jgi:signal transduction histidine kinase/ActR/RegA family two-component response regulator
VNETAAAPHLLRCVAELAQPERRAGAARALAEQAGTDDLIIFVRDAAIGRSLPAPGFPQTLRGGKVWADLVGRAIASGVATGTVTTPDGDPRAAHASGVTDGTVAVFLGGTLNEERASVIQVLLPFIGALFRSEAVAQRAKAESALARQSAAQSSELASKLDVTRAHLQQALSVAETATRARDEFLATVSHELRTPLTSILGWIQLLRDDSQSSASMDEGLDTIERNARAQSRLIEDILDFSRINAGKLRLDVRPIELPDVITEAIEVVRPGADAKGIRIDRMLDPNAGLVSGDPGRLQQVVWNLLSNATKFTPRGGRVRVRLERVSSHAELTVSDTGEGIPPDFLPFVFDRFSQADSTSTRTHSGLGLGLGIVKHLVELHGGTVQVFSPGVGQGATFVVRLPLVVAHHRGPAPVVPEMPAVPVRTSENGQFADLTGVSVLLVEDNDDARTLLTTILRRCGADVRAAENVPAALGLLNANRPDIIISDIEMPGEDGYSFIRKIRLHEAPIGRIPAIALTAYTRTADRTRALAAGFQTHMGKPVEPTELVAAVKSLLAATSRS